MTEPSDDTQKGAEAWSRAAPGYSQIGPQYFQYFGQRLVDFVHLFPSAAVLDVATGRGAVLFPAVRQVGVQGHVTGIDYSAGMVDQTNAEIAAKGITNAGVRQMNAEALEFAEGSFDFVLCSMAIFFFPHPHRALAEFHRVLKPGGKVALSIWGEDDPRWSWKQEMGRLLRVSGRTDNPNRLDTAEKLTEALALVKLVGMEMQSEAHEFYFADADEYWAFLWTVGSRLRLERAAPDAVENARAFAYQKLTEMHQPEGIPSVDEAVFVSAIKPEVSG